MKIYSKSWLVVTILALAVITIIAQKSASAAGPWYVAPGGNDGYDCLSPATACATINGALNKPGFVSGDTVLVATGVYTGTGTEVVRLNKSATLSGGWEAGFTTQSGTSTIDGQGARRGITVNLGIAAVVERFDVQNGYNGITNEGTLTLNNSAVQNGRNGIQNKGTLTLNNSIVSGNRTDGSGGGINNMMGSVGVLILNNSTVSGNTANGVGGGILNQHRQITLNNSTVSGNRSNGLGGGIHNGGGTAILNNSTVSANTAGESGGGIYNWDGAVTLQNSILGGNTAASSPDCSGAAVGSAGYNLVGSTSGCTFSTSTGDLTDVSARLGLLIGSPGYLPLLSGSPAIDAGNPDGCSGSTGPLTTDQRGAARVGRCDIGAYEYTVPGPAASIYAFGGTPQTAPPSVVFRTPLQAAVLDSIGSPVNNATVSFVAPASGASGTFADSGTFATSAVTNESGVATAAMFTANGLSGSYVVTAMVAGVVTPADFLLANKAWYVSPGGDDSSDCQAPTTPCSTINGALSKPAFVAGDIVLVATGVYTGTGDQVVLLDRDAILSGGWDAGFTTQSGTSTIDGQRARRGMTVDFGIIALVEDFVFQYGADGGIYNHCGSPGHLTLNDSTISGNTTDGHGGGIYNYGTLTVNNSTVSGNHAAGSGGGIHNYYVDVILNNSTITGNSAGEYGGGIYNSGYSDTIVTLNNSTVFGNTTWQGGGIFNSHATLILNSSTVSANTASESGGGMYTWEGGVTLRNSILGGNTADSDPDCSGDAVGSAGYNLVGSTSGCTFSASTGDLTDVDAGLGLLIGSPGYLPLLSGSPAIDAGNPDGCSGSTGPLTTDQRGAARVGRCDIGAYEYTVPGPAAKVYAFGGTPQTTPPSVVFRMPLQAAVVDSIGSPVGSAAVSFLAPASSASGMFEDSGTFATSAVTNESGVATAATFTANGLSGSYTVIATVDSVVTPAIFLLANKAWYVSPSGDDANDCQTPTTPCATINGALNKPGFVAGDTVVVATGVYTGTGDQVVLLDRNAALSGGWDAGFATQSGTSTIDGQGARRGITVNYATAVVERFVVQNGDGGSYGGGIRNGGTLTLNDCTVSGNAVSSGEYYGAGGGIYNSGVATLNNCTISGNTNDMYGGGIYTGQGILTLNDSTISGNTANYGGGVYNSIGTVVLQNSVLRENTASLGGGIYKNGGTTTLNNSAISGNWVYSSGGGIYDDAGTLNLNNSTISGNMASGSGGGISNEAGWDAGTMILNNSTVSGNTANEYCGGVFNGGTLTLNNSTVSGNTAGISRGGICGESTNTTLQNSILGGNKAGSAPDCFGTIGSAGYNLIGNTSDCTFSSGTGDLTNVDPNLGSLEGSPPYHPLLPGSPPVDAGNPAGCEDNKGNPLPTDQRGLPRFGRCDIGAYELQPLGYSALTVSPSDAFPGDPLTYTLALKNPGTADITNVRVTNTLPISLTYVDTSLSATSGSSSYQNGVVTWIGAVNASGAVTITYGATVTPTARMSTTIPNSAVINGGGEMITRTALLNLPPATVCLPLVEGNYCAPFRDDFSNPASGWPVGDNGSVRREYLKGEYRMLVRRTGSWAGARPGVKCSGYTVAVDVRNQTGVDGTYGLIFGLSDNWQQFYTFEIGPNRWFYLWRYDSGRWTVLAYGSSPAIHSGGGTNRLKVQRTGAHTIAYANNEMLVDNIDGTYTGLRHVGLITSSYNQPDVDARFDNFVMCAPGCSAAASLSKAEVPLQNSASPLLPRSANGASTGSTGSKTNAPAGLLPQPDSEPTGQPK